MINYAQRNYHSGKSSVKSKVKNFVFVAAVMIVGVGGIAVVSEVGHSLQMQRIAKAQ